MNMTDNKMVPSQQAVEAAKTAWEIVRDFYASSYTQQQCLDRLAINTQQAIDAATADLHHNLQRAQWSERELDQMRGWLEAAEKERDELRKENDELTALLKLAKTTMNAATRMRDEAVALLRICEGAADDCPLCYAPNHGIPQHKPDCRLTKLLKEVEG